MENIASLIVEYIKPELILIIPVCYLIGYAIKNSEMGVDKWIPFILGGVSIVLCTLYILATSPISNYQEVLMAIFVSITQGVLTAGCSVYINQLIKQYNKVE